MGLRGILIKPWWAHTGYFYRQCRQQAGRKQGMMIEGIWPGFLVSSGPFKTPFLDHLGEHLVYETGATTEVGNQGFPENREFWLCSRQPSLFCWEGEEFSSARLEWKGRRLTHLPGVRRDWIQVPYGFVSSISQTLFLCVDFSLRLADPTGWQKWPQQLQAHILPDR